MERFAIPGVGGIILNAAEGKEYVLFQERDKPDAPAEKGLLEIPAGKIREFENIFEALRREVFEETGLTVTEIEGEKGSVVYKSNGYRVLNFAPFSCAQNLDGDYPVMVLVFICHAQGTPLTASDESRNCRWVELDELGALLEAHPEKIYPMHVDTLKKFTASRKTGKGNR